MQQHEIIDVENIIEGATFHLVQQFFRDFNNRNNNNVTTLLTPLPSPKRSTSSTTASPNSEEKRQNLKRQSEQELQMLYNDVLQNKHNKPKRQRTLNQSCLICFEPFLTDKKIEKIFNNPIEKSALMIKWIKFRMGKTFVVGEKVEEEATERVSLREFIRRYNILNIHRGPCKHAVCSKCFEDMERHASKKKLQTSITQFYGIENINDINENIEITCPYRCNGKF